MRRPGARAKEVVTRIRKSSYRRFARSKVEGPGLTAHQSPEPCPIKHYLSQAHLSWMGTRTGAVFGLPRPKAVCGCRVDR